MEKVWLVKCLSHKCEELNLNPWHGIKSGTVVWACRLSAGEVEIGRSMELTDQPG